MISITKRLKNLELLDEAIANEYDIWGNTPEELEIHLDILIAGGAIEENLSLRDIIYYSCPYVKIDGSICDKGCIRIEGCFAHWNKKNKGSGITCKFNSCEKPTRSATGFCGKHNSGNR
jgi:hypothetical protein